MAHACSRLGLRVEYEQLPVAIPLMAEGWPSGLRRALGKRVGEIPHRFESCTFRHVREKGGGSIPNCQRTPVAQPPVDYGAGLKTNRLALPIRSVSRRRKPYFACPVVKRSFCYWGKGKRDFFILIFFQNRNSKGFLFSLL